MKKEEIIKEIIKMQTNNIHFVSPPKREDLERLRITDLNMIYNMTKYVIEQIPKTLTKVVNNKIIKYNFIKLYPNFALYENSEYKTKECFGFHDLGLIKQKVKPEK